MNWPDARDAYYDSLALLGSGETREQTTFFLQWSERRDSSLPGRPRLHTALWRIERVLEHLKRWLAQTETRQGNGGTAPVSQADTDSQGDGGTNEVPIRDRFKIEEGLVRFGEKDLGLPTGYALTYFSILHENYGKVVLYRELDEDHTEKESAASDQLKKSIGAINGALERNEIPCRIDNKSRVGYMLTDKG